MTGIKKHDFIEIEYTGTLQEDGTVFDTTDEKVAVQNYLKGEGDKYGPAVVCVGEQFLIKGLDDQLVGKEVGKEYTIDISAEEGFGKKDPKLLQMIPTSKFRQHRIQPEPGLQVNIDGSIGTIRTVSGGRTIVDMNHPLAGKDIRYQIKINKLVEDEEQKVETVLRHMGVQDLEFEVKDHKLTLKLYSELQKEIQDEFTRRVKELVPTLTDVSFEIKKGGKKKGKDAPKAATPEAEKQAPGKEESAAPKQEQKPATDDTPKQE